MAPGRPSQVIPKQIPFGILVCYIGLLKFQDATPAFYRGNRLPYFLFYISKGEALSSWLGRGETPHPCQNNKIRRLKMSKQSKQGRKFRGVRRLTRKEAAAAGLHFGTHVVRERGRLVFLWPKNVVGCGYDPLWFDEAQYWAIVEGLEDFWADS